MSPSFIQIINASVSTITNNTNSYSLELISGSLSILQNTTLSGQDYFLRIVDSSSHIDNMVVKDIQAKGQLFNIVQSNFTISNLQVSNYTSNLGVDLVLSSVSQLQMENITIINSTLSFVSFTYSTVIMKNIRKYFSVYSFDLI